MWAGMSVRPGLEAGVEPVAFPAVAPKARGALCRPLRKSSEPRQGHCAGPFSVWEDACHLVEVCAFSHRESR